MTTLTTPGPAEFERLSTRELREQFLLGGLFQPGKAALISTNLDRLIVGGIVPAPELTLMAGPELRANFFHERRETGVINIGDPGEVIIDGKTLAVGSRECVYIGMGARDVRFRNGLQGQAAFYLLSCPAHREFPSCLATESAASLAETGNTRHASRRRIVRYIHETGVQSCQLVMGYTELSEGSVWNTWPAHTHLRRSEIYLYFDLNGGLVTHFLGRPTETRHVVIREREAVLSPPWSIHSGVGTNAYRFVWGMAGENRTFEDMDPIDENDFA